MPRLVRRTPLIERIKSYLDPYDFLLWLSEELNDDLYDEVLKAWAVPIGVGLNFLFIVARGASKPGESRDRDDVFGDYEGKRGSGWFSWLVSGNKIPMASSSVADNLQWRTGWLPRPSTHTAVLSQCLLYLLPETTLSSFRTAR